MPESKKISELPPFATVQANDILPIVDYSLTQTGKCTAAQIALIGGGPPGVNTVSTDKLQNGAVTYPKIQNVATDRILGRATAGAGVVEEIPCTAFGRAWLAYADAIAASNGLTLNLFTAPTFTGQVKTDRGTAAAPAYTFTPDTTTGIFSPDSGAVAITTDSYERFRIDTDGNMLMPYNGVGLPRLAYPVRAWVNFDGTVGAAQVINRASLITIRYGLTNTGVANSLWNEPNTRAKIIQMETAMGYTLLDQNISSTAVDGRTNYTTPGDNKHWYWNPAANNGAGGWAQISASGRPWIGSITFTSAATTAIRDAGNIITITRPAATGHYRCYFQTPMPDNKYSVVACAHLNTNVAWGFASVGATDPAFFDLITVNANAALFNSAIVTAVVVR